jgi:hypothetical protein
MPFSLWEIMWGREKESIERANSPEANNLLRVTK